jgi:C-terminal processing protease CtpA/Prc
MFYTYNQRNNDLNETHFNGIYQPFMQTPKKQPSSLHTSQAATTTLPINTENVTYTNSFEEKSNIQYKYIDIFVELYRQESGFGFRIVGGEEEGSQVSVGYIVPNGAADLDARLKPNDEIVMIDNENVIGASHKRVVRLMTIAGLNRKVKLWIKRKVPINLADNTYPFTITLFRHGHEGFGFVIISATNRNGPSIGMLYQLLTINSFFCF